MAIASKYSGIQSWGSWSNKHQEVKEIWKESRGKDPTRKLAQKAKAAGTRAEYNTYSAFEKAKIDDRMVGSNKGYTMESALKGHMTYLRGTYGKERTVGKGNETKAAWSESKFQERETYWRKNPAEFKAYLNRPKKKFKDHAKTIAAGIAIVYTGGMALAAMGGAAAGGAAAAAGSGMTAGMGGMAASNAAIGAISAGGMTTAGAAGLTGALSPALAAVQAGTFATYGAAAASGLSTTGTVAGTAAAATGGGGLYNSSALTSAPGAGPGVAGSTAGQVGVGGVTGGAGGGTMSLLGDWGSKALDYMGGWEGVVGSGLDMYNQYQSGQAMEAGSQAAFAAENPFAQYRDKYASQMDSFMSDPNAITETPGYKFQMEQGMEAVNRSSAFKGTRMAGENYVEANKFGSGLAAQMRQSEIDNLAMLSGANWTGSGGNNLVNAATAESGAMDQITSTLGTILGYNAPEQSPQTPNIGNVYNANPVDGLPTR